MTTFSIFDGYHVGVAEPFWSAGANSLRIPRKRLLMAVPALVQHAAGAAGDADPRLVLERLVADARRLAVGIDQHDVRGVDRGLALTMPPDCRCGLAFVWR